MKSNFGPKATLKKVQNNDQLMLVLLMIILFKKKTLNFFLFHSVIQDPSSQRLHWISPPNNILIIRKPGPQTLPEFRILILKLLKVRKLL